MARGLFGESRPRLELGIANQFGEFRAIEVVFDDFCLVQPMFDVVALDDDAGLVPLTDGFEGFGGIACDQSVQGSRAGLGVFAVGMFGVVRDLVFRAGFVRGGCGFSDPVHDAAIGACGDFPIEPEFEVGVGLTTHNIATTTTGDTAESVFFDRPALGGKLGLFEAAKVAGGGAVEEGLPLGGAQLRSADQGDRGADKNGGEEAMDEFFHKVQPGEN